jgi:chromosome segregation ATPase|tara:strand:+ start:221 stop:472 length:252 start_codon:yes stop_codon:yes gene_type:complete
MEKVSLSKEEIQIIKDIQQKEQEIVSQLGQIEYQILSLNSQKEDLKDAINDINKKGNKLGEDLQQKYGDGSINIETGEFTKSN